MEERQHVQRDNQEAIRIGRKLAGTGRSGIGLGARANLCGYVIEGLVTENLEIALQNMERHENVNSRRST